MGTAHASAGAQVRAVMAHLRLPVQLTLAPLFLWGMFGGGRLWTARAVTVFIALHLFLYGGATLFNSYYDRDEGPIMGMERPLALPAWALPWSLAWQGLGLLVIAFTGPALVIFYLAYALVAIFYSHPRVRLKARPILSAVLIFVLQGVGGFVAGWLASAGALPLISARFWSMALAAGCTTVALYPLSQVFQLTEDQARGDRTLAMVLGPERSFVFAVAAFMAAALAGAVALLAMRRPGGGIVLVVGYGVLGAAVARIGALFSRRPLLATYHRLATVQFAASAALAAFVGLELAHPF